MLQREQNMMRTQLDISPGGPGVKGRQGARLETRTECYKV